MPTSVIYIVSGMLTIGSAPMPYGYYTLLRLIATGAFAWAAVVTYERKEEVLPWVFCMLSILFNPFIKVHLPKETWMVIDIVAGVFFLVSKPRIQKQQVGNLKHG